MRKKRIVKPDGRYLILYEFDDMKLKEPPKRKETTETAEPQRIQRSRTKRPGDA